MPRGKKAEQTPERETRWAVKKIPSRLNLGITSNQRQERMGRQAAADRALRSLGVRRRSRVGNSQIDWLPRRAA
jgi:hypothetical protein